MVTNIHQWSGRLGFNHRSSHTTKNCTWCFLATKHCKVLTKRKGSSLGKGVAPSRTPQCSSDGGGSLPVALDYGQPTYIYIYIYIQRDWIILQCREFFKSFAISLIPKGTLQRCKIKLAQSSLHRKILKIWFSPKMALLHNFAIVVREWLSAHFPERWMCLSFKSPWWNQSMCFPGGLGNWRQCCWPY